MKSKPLLLLLPLLLLSCGGSPSSEPSFVAKEIGAHYLNHSNDTTAQIRYYEGGSVPYISLKEYVRLLYRGRKYETGRDKFDITKSGKVYTIDVAGGGQAKFDVSENTFESADLWSFKNTNLNGTGDEANVSYDGLPFTRVKKVTHKKASQATKINFNDYGFRVYGDETNVYVPVAFASDLLSNENILQGAYNGKDLYFFYYTGNEEISAFGADYYEAMYASPIKQDYAEFTYNELCLDYDFFAGRPGRSSLERYYDLSKGLDKALQSRPLGRTIREYLKSTDKATFLAGATLLGYLRDDGGHSVYAPLNTAYSVEKDGKKQAVVPSYLDESTKSSANALINLEKAKDYEEITNKADSSRYRLEIYKARSEKLGKRNSALSGIETYTKDGDVAYIHIDGFMGEIGLRDEWDKYYAGTRDSIPFGEGMGGAVGAISHGLKKAHEDNEVKHLVIDLSANSGGSTDEMLFLIRLLTKESSFYSYNRVRDDVVTAEYEFDLNFDRKFDEKDEEMLHCVDGKDITILTTRNGFSCGGISPIYLHEEGLFTIGEDCGGGSCSIYIQFDAYGNLNRVSSPSQTVTKNGKSVDAARVGMCDAPLQFPFFSGKYDYSSLYDTASLRRLIEEHYA